MKFLLLFLSLTSLAYSNETRVKIAVLDTGVDLETSKQSYMCEDGNIILDPQSTGFDVHGHGSNIASAIGENIDPTKFCIVSYQIMSGEIPVSIFQNRLVRVKNDIIQRHIKFVNMSVQGDGRSLEEYYTLKAIVKSGAIISIAAGNHARNLDEKCDEYPACYNTSLQSKNIHIVGANNTKWSNFGKFVKYSESGRWKRLSGTSQACALHTAKVVMEYYKN